MDGKPKMVSERYLGSAADVEAGWTPREAGCRTDPASGVRGRGRGVVAADRAGRGRGDRRRWSDAAAGAAASSGTYLALAALGRLVEPGSKEGSPTGGAPPPGTGSPRSAQVLDHRKFWDAMHAVR